MPLSSPSENLQRGGYPSCLVVPLPPSGYHPTFVLFTNLSQFVQDIPSFSTKVPGPGNPFSPRQTRTAGNSVTCACMHTAPANTAPCGLLDLAHSCWMQEPSDRQPVLGPFPPAWPRCSHHCAAALRLFVPNPSLPTPLFSQVSDLYHDLMALPAHSRSSFLHLSQAFLLGELLTKTPCPGQA